MPVRGSRPGSRKALHQINMSKNLGSIDKARYSLRDVSISYRKMVCGWLSLLSRRIAQDIGYVAVCPVRQRCRMRAPRVDESVSTTKGVALVFREIEAAPPGVIGLPDGGLARKWFAPVHMKRCCCSSTPLWQSSDLLLPARCAFHITRGSIYVRRRYQSGRFHHRCRRSGLYVRSNPCP